VSEQHRHIEHGRSESVGVAGRVTRLLLAAGLASGVGGSMIGCESDSFMDPSVVGRWEYTPTRVPILDRLSIIEGEPEGVIETSDPTPADLIAEIGEYRMGPGDVLTITVFDLTAQNERLEFQRQIDLRGEVNLPEIGQVSLNGLTAEEGKAAIIERLKESVLDPFVALSVEQRRQQIYYLSGSFEQPGPYPILEADFRLLSAMASGGRFSESLRDVLVVREVSLAEADTSASPPGVTTPTPRPAAQPQEGQRLIDLVEQLTRPSAPGQPAPPGTPPPQAPPAQPPGQPPTQPGPDAPPPIDLPGGPGMGAIGMVRSAASQPEPALPPPAIDLPDVRSPRASTPATAAPQRSATRWVFLNGEWVRTGGQTRQGEAPAARPEPTVTQRVIRIPMRNLLAGDARYNIVVRPGDTIRLPQPEDGLVYMAGQVQRVGPIQLPGAGRMTLTRAIDSAGGLTPIAIPERVDLTRVVGDKQQATIRLNFRAIVEGTQPDIYVKPDDRINVGTNFWATPLAIVRNGFRATYGFGLLVDRNFGSDIFGVPPESESRFR
jgi:polysaccharide export outer membrane protein